MVLHRKDTGWVRETIIKTLKKGGLSEKGEQIIKKYCRVSKAGNIMLADKLLLPRKFFNFFRKHDKTVIREILTRLKDDVMKEIIGWIEQGGPNFPGIRQLILDDFDLNREATEEEKEILESKFLKAHKQCIDNMKNEIKLLLAGIDEEIWESIIPPDILNRLNCEGNIISIEYIENEFVFLIACSCGICGEVNTFESPQILNNNWNDIREVEREVVKHCFSYYESFQLLEKLEHCCNQAKDIERNYFLTQNARSKLEGIKVIKAALKRPDSITCVYSDRENLWRFGSQRLPNISVETVYEIAQNMLRDVQEGKLFPRENISKRLKEAWESVGKAMYEDVQKTWLDLPFGVKIKASVIKKYEKLVAFANSCANGEIILSPRGEISIGNVTVHTANEEKFIENTMQHLWDEFKKVVSETNINYDPHLLYHVLYTIKENPKEMGVTTVAALLTGSKSQKIISNKYDKSSSYGVLKGVITQKELNDLIKNMVKDGLINVAYVGWHDLPVLYIHETVEKQLESMQAPEPIFTEKKQSVSIEEAVNKREWDKLAEMAKENWSAEAALKTAAVLWPSGKAAKAVKTMFAN